MTTATRAPQLTAALNYCITTTGCNKVEAAQMVIGVLVRDLGMPIQDATDAVHGPGTYKAIADACWEALQPA
jgi:hypothetical protein